MSATDLPPKKGVARDFAFGVRSVADGNLKSTPTLNSSDWKVSVDYGAFANVSALPTNSPAASVQIKWAATSSEMNGDTVTLWGRSSTSEFVDVFVIVNTVTRQMTDLAYPAVSGRSLTVSSTGAADANLTLWLGVQPSSLLGASSNMVGVQPTTYGAGAVPWLSTQMPANSSALRISTTGAVDSNLTQVNAASSAAAFLDAAVSGRASSTAIPTNLQYLTVSSSQGYANANIAAFNATTGFGSVPSSSQSFASSTGVKDQLVSALSSDLYVALTSAPSASAASLATQIGFGYALSRYTLVATSSQQRVLTAASSANLATAVLTPTTSDFTRTAWV